MSYIQNKQMNFTKKKNRSTFCQTSNMLFRLFSCRFMEFEFLLIINHNNGYGIWSCLLECLELLYRHPTDIILVRPCIIIYDCSIVKCFSVSYNLHFPLLSKSLRYSFLPTTSLLNLWKNGSLIGRTKYQKS